MTASQRPRTARAGARFRKRRVQAAPDSRSGYGLSRQPRAITVVASRNAPAARAPATVLLTTHYIEEAEALCERVAFIRAGRIISEGAPTELIERYGGDRLEDAYVEAMRQ